MRVLGHISTALLEIASTDDFEWIINSMLEVRPLYICVCVYIYVSNSIQQLTLSILCSCLLHSTLHYSI